MVVQKCTLKKLFILSMSVTISIILALLVIRLSFTMKINKLENYITTDDWTTIATCNDLFVSSIEITSDIYNKDELYIRVVNDDGAIIHKPEIIPIGEKIFLKDKLFSKTNNIIIQAKSDLYNDVYLLDIKSER